jgi:hypothetical protein
LRPPITANVFRRSGAEHSERVIDTHRRRAWERESELVSADRPRSQGSHARCSQFDAPLFVFERGIMNEICRDAYMRMTSPPVAIARSVGGWSSGTAPSTIRTGAKTVVYRAGGRPPDAADDASMRH